VLRFNPTRYVASRAPALSPDASWADRTEVVHWLPEDLHEFDKRLGLDKPTPSQSASATDASSSLGGDNVPVAKESGSLSTNELEPARKSEPSAIETEVAAKVKELTR